MEFITVEDVAKLKGCSLQYIQKLIKDGKLESKTELNEKNRPKYLIPISALPDDIKAKYYTQIRGEENAPPELKKPAAETPLKDRLKNIPRRNETK